MPINADGKKGLGALITQTIGFCFKNKGIENKCKKNNFLQMTTQKLSMLLSAAGFLQLKSAENIRVENFNCQYQKKFSRYLLDFFRNTTLDKYLLACKD